MELDLARLKDMHPLLPAVLAAAYELHGSIALQRNGHAPGVELEWTDRGTRAVPDPVVKWSPPPGGASAVADHNRSTEDGAEAIALALASQGFGWSIRRRLQRGESADWLLQEPAGELLALEISGIDGLFDAIRLSSKVKQAAAAAVPHRYACVVAFARPEAELAQA